jgi:twitching motility protein PilT
MAEMDKYFRLMVEHGTSDLHLCTGCKPMFRKDGSIVALKSEDELPAEKVEQMLFEITPPRNLEEFKTTNDTDFAYSLEGYGRYPDSVEDSQL